MHRSRQLMDELRRAKREVMKHESEIEVLNTQIAKVSQELEAFPTLSDQMAVEITENDVIFLTANSEFTLTLDELQVLVEMLDRTHFEKAGEKAVAKASADLRCFCSSREAADSLADEVTESALNASPRGSWYYRVRTGSPLRTVFSDDKTWKFRQILRRKAQNKNPQKLVIEVVIRAKNDNPCRILLTRTLHFGGSPAKLSATK